MKILNIKTGKTALTIAAFSISFLTGCEKEELLEDGSLSHVQESEASAAQGHEHVANQVLVKFKAGTSGDVRARALSRVSGRVQEVILTRTMERFGDKEGLLLVHTPMAALEAIGKLRGAAEIEYAEPNFIYRHHATSNDPYYTNGSLWGMYGGSSSPANQYGSHASAAWAGNHVGSPTVVIGIIDEGVMHAHADLQANIWTNPGEIAGNGIDDDGNGYVDDVYGWDFDGNNNSTYDGTNDDHGTHVAGTIGAKGGNGTGVAGVVWNVKMITAKFLGRNGGTTANAIKSVDYITDLKKRHGLNLVATNNSWGGGGFSQGLYEAINRANAENILFVAAAGNGGRDGVGDDNDKTPHYPSSYANANIISVASITSSGAKSGFSNYGATSVDIGAPGSGIYSTLPGRKDASNYGSYSGTSMATPHVTGAVALYAASNTSANAATIKNAILSSATATSSLTGKCVSGGRLNVSSY
ncbi:subtilisin family serine protease [Pontibacter aydingkolensis]|uniref:S8 family serine peptidase n=1 Tax=Pontibacter aydingkolensis TaxID=1911536 RepID=A0ABS7CY88_9BACT|nr:S8 family peptidase [Pontibacter aydingkolensis]MBW7468763.1 S8 family serine peptidase [Pontibacter aydingkolensis]